MPNFKSSSLVFVNSSGIVVILHQARNLSRNKFIANKFFNLTLRPQCITMVLNSCQVNKSADLSITLPVGGAYHNKVGCQIHYHITHPVEQHLKDIGTALQSIFHAKNQHIFCLVHRSILNPKRSSLQALPSYSDFLHTLSLPCFRPSVLQR